MRYSLFFFSIVLASLSSCNKGDEPSKILRAYPDQDMGIQFALYQAGRSYQDDTLRNQLIIKNHGPEVLRKDDVIKTACTIGGVVWAFDLMSAGPTSIVLDKDLEVGGEIEVNPGYLYGPDILEYFTEENVDVCILVYGVNNTVTDLALSDDPVKENNKQCINYHSSGKIKLN